MTQQHQDAQAHQMLAQVRRDRMLGSLTDSLAGIDGDDYVEVWFDFLHYVRAEADLRQAERVEDDEAAAGDE